MDYYQVLGVASDATHDTIVSAFRHLAFQWHPDLNKSPEAEDKFKEIWQAYEIIGNPETRNAYDRDGNIPSAFSSPLEEIVDQTIEFFSFVLGIYLRPWEMYVSMFYAEPKQKKYAGQK